MGEMPNSINANGVAEPFSTEDVPWETFSKGTRFGIRYQALGEYGGCSQIGVCMEILEPGKQTYPAHYHMLEEEHVYILEGSLTLRLGDKTYPMGKGDYVCFPAGQKAGHTLVNEGKSACRYLMIGNRNEHEVVVYTDANRVGVRALGEGYDASATMEYWENTEIDS